MSALTKKKKYTPEEYLALEEKAEFRSKFDNGKIVAIAGGSVNHARIIKNIDRSIDRKIKNSCESFTSEVKSVLKIIESFIIPIF